MIQSKTLERSEPFDCETEGAHEAAILPEQSSQNRSRRSFRVQHGLLGSDTRNTELCPARRCGMGTVADSKERWNHDREFE